MDKGSTEADRNGKQMPGLHSHIFLRHLVRTLPFEVVVRDADSRILFCNQAFANTSGGTAPDNLVGRLDRDVWSGLGRPAEEIDAWLAEDQEILATGQTKEYVQEIRRENGEVVYFHNIKQPIELADGTRCILAVYHDLTERKQMDVALEEARREALELATIHRTAITYAHEINNPLTGLLGLIQLIGDETENNAEVEAMLGEMKELVRRITEVTNRLLKLQSPRVRKYLSSEMLDLDASEQD